MFTIYKFPMWGVTAACLIALSACASKVPRISNAALGYAVTNYDVSADRGEEALAEALRGNLSLFGPASAMPAMATVSIDAVRYNSPIIGLFYGGQHYASLSVVLTDTSGAKISNFPLYVAANGARSSADEDLADAAARIIAANAANAYMPIKAIASAQPKPALSTIKKTITSNPQASPEPVEIAPAIDNEAPCVIGPDGKCIAL